jgi:Histidine kinase
MTLSETWRALRARWRRPSHVFALLFFYVPYVSLALWTNHRMGNLTNPWLVAGSVLVPFLLVAGLIWLSPLFWQWNGESQSVSFDAMSGVRAFLASQGFIALWTFFDYFLRVRGGQQSPLLTPLLVAFCFQGPLVFFVGGLSARWEASESEKDQIRHEARQAQIRLLQNQLHPHVLFNSLNGLAELIHRDPRTAERNVRHLSRLLHKILEAEHRSLFFLWEERALVEDYLSLESMRLGDRLRLSWDWDESLNESLLPPLLLQPLVENAIKHGIAPMDEGGSMVVQARRENEELIFVVRNTGGQIKGDPIRAKGIGLRNLRARLELAYHGAAHFRIERELGWTLAEIRLPVGQEGAL